MNEPEERRTVKLTSKAWACKIETLQKDRQSNVKKIKGITHEIKELMKNDDNAKEVQTKLDKLIQFYENAKAAHESVLILLPKEEKETQIDWFKRVTKHSMNFTQDIEQWLLETGRIKHVTTTAETNLTLISPEEVPVELKEQIPSSQLDVEATVDIQDDIQPKDSVSNVGSKKSKLSSAVSSSRVSSASSARVKAEAEVAALVVRQRHLKDKHTLEEQEDQLRRKKEQLEIEADIAATVAKIKVLGASRASSVQSHFSHTSDGMESYFEKGQEKKMADSNVEIDYSSKHSVINPQMPMITTKERTGTQTQSFPRAHLTQSGSNPGEHPQVTCSASRNNEQNNITAIMERQNEITALLVQQHCLSSLPKKEIQVFDGNPLQYQTFIKSFEHNIESQTPNPKDGLYYLEQYTTGQPRELIRSCLHMAADRGFTTAKSLLQQHFGNEFKIATAYMDKALSWSSIKPDDTKSLQAYALFLRGCCNAMEDINYMYELNLPTNMLNIIRKLPYRLRDKWRTAACDLHERKKQRATFKDLVNFLEKQVRIETDPVFGNIKDTPTVSKDIHRFKSQPQPRIKGSIFATTVTAAEQEKDKETRKQSRSTVQNCLYCKKEHALELCPQLEKREHTEKLSFIKENGICFGCLCKGHISKDCRKRLRCDICGLKHPKMLHIHQKKKEMDKNQAERKEMDRVSASVQTSGLTGAGHDNCKLSIVPVQVKAKKGSAVVHTYAFLDPGSTASFCTVQLMNKLNLQGRKTNILLSTMGQKKVVGTNLVSGLEVARLDSTESCELPDVYTQKTMPVHKGNITHQADINRWPYLRKIQLTELDSEIDLLIGSNVPKALEPLDVIRSIDDGPYAVKTMLGWTINGPLGVNNVDTHSTISINRISVVKLDELWEQQFKTDFPECNRDDLEHSKEDQQFLDSVSKSAELVDGHYCIGLPFKQRKICMPDNKSVAEQRTLNLKKRFKRDSSFHLEYTNFMSDTLHKGYAEKVPEGVLERKDGRKWYLPHHGVLHPQKNKLRVVFDCGATFQGVSLNSQLLQGPDLTSTLIGVLCRFRKEPIVIAADIEAMFHQVKVPNEDRDLLRFLWWPNGDYNQNMAEYRMTVHLFGATSSPSCANFALRKCAEDNIKQFNPQAVKTILNNFYVDDCLTSAASEEDAIALYQELRAICFKGGFLLTKWISNSRHVLAAIPETMRAEEVKNLDLDHDNLPVERVLGVQWCVQSDVFKFKITLKDRPLTRRGILSIVSSVYDPLGILAPVVLKAKKILQDLCRRKMGWDETVPDSIVQEWISWIQDLQKLENFKVDRCYKPANFGTAASAQLHHFADACEDGYGTVSYLLLHNKNGEAHCGFVMGKARVAPLKLATIPRMELTAATMASRMDTMLRKELQMELTDSIFWTDSTSVLKYINNKTTRFRTFVSNRISQIGKVSHALQWRYVNTINNPADMASRGLSVNTFLRKQTWVSGPQFLLGPQEEWPKNPDGLDEISPKDCEIRSTTVNAVQITSEEVDPITRLIHYYSSWSHLKRAVAWMLRLKGLLLDPSRKKKQNKRLTVEELASAETIIICFCQKKSYGDEISHLRKGMNVKRTSHIHKLNPILENKILRVGGRLSRAAMPEEIKHPVIVPKNSHISNLILHHIHQEVGHGGRNHMLSKLRQKYWIPSATVSIRKIVSRCVTCRRINAPPGQQQMADLPLDRVSPDEPPFTYVGVDYFGPFGVKRGRSVVKRYGVIFTCLAIRAIHIEMASSLDTDSFISALRRFAARRGQVKELRSDNGTNFVGAQRELKEAIEGWNQGQIHNSLLQKGINWIFHPPAGSHHGGVWERLIRSIRKVLNSTLNMQNLDEEGLQTVLCEAEAILNSRPITKASTDPNDLEALTPNHLLLLKTMPSLPPGQFQKEDIYARRRWRQVQYMSELFWKRWIKEYLPQLQERQKWSRLRRNFKLGDIVIIIDDSAPRNSWPLGKIVETTLDKKGLVRSLRIKTKTGYLTRPINKVCLLQEAEEAEELKS